jgi:hypothetical protein
MCAFLVMIVVVVARILEANYAIFLAVVAVAVLRSWT